MDITEIPLEQLHPAPYSPNEMDERMLRRLAASIGRFGSVLPLVVRPFSEGFEVIGGNQRLRVYRQQQVQSIACIILPLDDTQARLLAQGLNALHGQDDPGKRIALLRDLMQAMRPEELASVLPESVESLRSFASLGEQSAESLGQQLAGWAKVQEAKAAARLAVTSFSLGSDEKEAVERAIGLALPRFAETEGPNRRGLALGHICAEWAAGRSYQASRRPRRRE